MAFIEVTDPTKWDALAEAQLLWYKGTEWAEEDYVPFLSAGPTDLPSKYNNHHLARWRYYLLIEE